MADYSSYMLVMKNVSKTFNPGTALVSWAPRCV